MQNHERSLKEQHNGGAASVETLDQCGSPSHEDGILSELRCRHAILFSDSQTTVWCPACGRMVPALIKVGDAVVSHREGMALRGLASYRTGR